MGGNFTVVVGSSSYSSRTGAFLWGAPCWTAQVRTLTQRLPKGQICTEQKPYWPRFDHIVRRIQLRCLLVRGWGWGGVAISNSIFSIFFFILSVLQPQTTHLNKWPDCLERTEITVQNRKPDLSSMEQDLVFQMILLPQRQRLCQLVKSIHKYESTKIRFLLKLCQLSNSEESGFSW